MLEELKDYLKTLDLADYYYVGKIDNKREKVIGVYSLSKGARVEAIGRESSYDKAGFQILVHWNKNAVETEATARQIFEALRYITNTEMGDLYVYYLDLDIGEPVFLGTDQENVYEYHISGTIYYRR